MRSIVPTPQQIAALTGEGHEGPIVMVNLLKYRDKAAYESGRPEAAKGLSGRDAYRRYGAVAVKCMAEVGAAILWAGQQKLVAVGDGSDEWDDVVLVRYPSRRAFNEMVSRPDYLAGSYHREAGLERTALLCCGAGAAA